MLPSHVTGSIAEKIRKYERSFMAIDDEIKGKGREISSTGEKV
jgi:hypothetical protein